MRGTARAATTLALAFLVVSGAGCGGGEEEPEGSPAPPPTAVSSPTAVAPESPEPTPTPGTYVVKAGDTLSEIAERFDTTVRALVRANDIEDPSLIFPGDELIIPERGGG